MTLLRKLYRSVGAYLASDDPRTRIAMTVVAVVVGNQPFYPAYVWWIAGSHAWPALVTWLSTPFFAAVPAVSRRARTPAKLLLLGAGIGNTALCAAVLGRASGVELFYLPCLLLGIVLFDPRERLLGVLAAGLPVALLLAVLGGAGVAGFTPAQDASLRRLHAISVGCLMIVLSFSTRTALAALRKGTGPAVTPSRRSPG